MLSPTNSLLHRDSVETGPFSSRSLEITCLILVYVQEQVFFCFSPVSLAELEQITEKCEGEMEGEFSCSLCNFKSYCLLQEHSGQSVNYMRVALVPPRAHLRGLLLGTVLTEATKLAVWS